MFAFGALKMWNFCPIPKSEIFRHIGTSAQTKKSPITPRTTSTAKNVRIVKSKLPNKRLSVLRGKSHFFDSKAWLNSENGLCSKHSASNRASSSNSIRKHCWQHKFNCFCSRVWQLLSTKQSTLLWLLVSCYFLSVYYVRPYVTRRNDGNDKLVMNDKIDNQHVVA